MEENANAAEPPEIQSAAQEQQPAAAGESAPQTRNDDLDNDDEQAGPFAPGTSSELNEGPQPIEGLISGRTVHYVLPIPYSAGQPPEIRPAVIVRVWDAFAGTSNLQVFTDGDNDRALTGTARRFPGDTGVSTVWKTSVVHSEEREPGTWHWPPRG